MSSHRSSNPFLESSQHGPSRRASISTTSSRRYQDSSTRSSGHQSSYEDLTKAFKQISVAQKRLQEQEMRAADAEQQVLALVDKLKLVNQERIAAIQQASKANEELTLYKIQLQTAHQEIRRGQEIIDKVEHDRYEAEKAAAEARRMARTYQRDLMIMRAMDEGRKLGMQEGIEQGRALALREFDMTDDDLAAEYMEYNEEPLQRSNLLASNEDLLNHLPKQSDVEPLVQPPPLESGEPIPVPPPDLVQRTPLPIPDLVQPTPLPIPDLIQVTPVMRPRSFRSPSPSILHQPISIPPDGYVPTLDSDNVIRIPPPHELSRPPPTPERGPSPQLPEIIQEEPRPSSRSHRRRMSNSSMTSGSTFSNAAGHMGRPPSALSAIPEAQSPYSSPVPEMGLHLRHQASHASNFSNIVDPEPIGGLRDAPGQSASRRSSMAGSTRPGSVQEDRRKSKSTISSVPGITVVPPSRPLSSGTLRSQLAGSDVSRPTSIVSQLFGDRPFGQPASPPHASPQALPIPMPGTYQQDALLDQRSMRSQSRPASSNDHRFVDDDDATSVRSGYTLTTPQTKRRSRHRSQGSLDSLTTLPLETRSAVG